MYAFLSPLSYSILNKLTPDNFERLCYELTHHINFPNKEILKGAILLVCVLCVCVCVLCVCVCCVCVVCVCVLCVCVSQT